MKQLLFLVCALLCAAARVQAQALPIHDPVDKVAYSSDVAELPTYSGQCHWNTRGVNPMSLGLTDAEIVQRLKDGTLVPAHTHVDLTFAANAEVPGPITVNFAIKLFHTSGHVGGFWPGLYHVNHAAHDVVFDETGTNRPAGIIAGDPVGLVTKTGHFIIEPEPNFHGWQAVEVAVETDYDNGDSVVTHLIVPIYSVTNAALPEFVGPQGPGLPYMSATCDPISAHSDVWGTQIVELHEELPLLPLTMPFTRIVWANGYGAQDQPPSFLETRLDLDLHNGILGTTLFSKRGNGFDGKVDLTFTVDPEVLKQSPKPAGSSTHKLALIRTQTSTSGLEQATALLVFNANVAGSGTVLPPPPPPPPAPTVAFVPVPVLGLQETIDGVPQNIFKLCVADETHCIAVP